MSWTRIDGSTDDLVTLEITKAHLRVDHTEEDVLIASYIAAAIDYAESFCRRPLLPGKYHSDNGYPAPPNAVVTPGEDGTYTVEVDNPAESIKIAVLLLVGHWYANREAVVTGTITATVPMGVDALLWPHRLLGW